MYATANILNAS